MRAILILIFIVATKSIPVAEWSKIKPIRISKPVLNLVKYADDKPRIVGGTEASTGAFPFQAGVFIDNHWFCGGSLISENIILTAAHCALGFSTFDIYLGSHNIRATAEDGRLVTTTSNAIVHNNFDPQMFTNDIALLKLNSPVTFTDLIKPIRLPTESQIEQDFAGKIAKVSGWGLTSEIGMQSEVLLYTEVPIMNNTECQSVYLPGLIHERMLCVYTSGGQHGPCNGDSGGPLIIKEEDGEHTEVGIVSWGADAGCDGGYPEVFTRITYYLDWIASNGGPAIRP